MKKKDNFLTFFKKIKEQKQSLKIKNDINARMVE